MSNILQTDPLAFPMQYDPVFRVEACLHEPLWVYSLTRNDVALTILSVCSQLELLCRKELEQNARIENGKVSNSFETKAMMLLDKIKKQINRFPHSHPEVMDYMESTGISTMFPKAMAYIEDPEGFSIEENTKTNMDEYIISASRMYRIFSLAKQIDDVVMNNNNHKYVAHQLSLLHQALGTYSNSPVFHDLKLQLESKFTLIKDILTNSEESKPTLPDEDAELLHELMEKICNAITSFPSGISQAMLEPALCLNRL